MVPNLSWDEEDEEEEEEPAEESLEKSPKGQADKKGNAAKVHPPPPPLELGTGCAEGSLCHGGPGMQPLLGAFPCPDPRDGLLRAPTEPQTPLCNGGEL